MDDAMNYHKEPVRVLVRLRPRMDLLPHHPVYHQALNSAAHNPDCLFLMDSTTLKISSEAKCVCKECMRKAGQNADGRTAERFGTTRNKKDKFFRFDKICPAMTTQSELYDEVADSVLSCIQGYNSTIMVYGPSGTGKSHTMIGTIEDPGIIPRVIVDTFHVIDNTRAQDLCDVYFHMEMSFVEMYNNAFKNLLRSATHELNKIEAAGGDVDKLTEEQSETMSGIVDNYESVYAKYEHEKLSNDKISVHESPALGVFLTGKNLRIPVRTAEEALNYYRLGNKVRAMRGTEKDESSSRSHAVLTLHVESKLTVDNFDEEELEQNAEMLGLSTKSAEFRLEAEFEKELNRAIDLAASSNSSSNSSAAGGSAKFEIRLGKIHLVHLAGSERLKETHASGGTMKETQNINKSLLALGEVLHSLSINCTTTNPGSEVHVPYYNSKLTHMLKDSLGGNSKSTMVCTLGSESSIYHHSLYSLMFAARAFKVLNLVRVNRLIIDPKLLEAKDDATILKELKQKLLDSASATPLKSRFAKLTRNNSDVSAKMSSRETLTPIRTAKPDMSALTRVVAKSAEKRPLRTQRSAADMLRLDSKSITEENNEDEDDAIAAAAAEEAAKVPAAPVATVYTLWVDGLVAQDLKYVTFPLCPIIKLKVGCKELQTSRRVYKSSVEYPECFQIEFLVEDFNNGLTLEVAAANVNPFGVTTLIGDGSMELQSVLSAVDTRDQENFITVELLDSDDLVTGRITFYACLMERSPSYNAKPLFVGEISSDRGAALSLAGSGSFNGSAMSTARSSSSLDKYFTAPTPDKATTAAVATAVAGSSDKSKLIVRRIVCSELPLEHHASSAVTPDAEFDFLVTVEVNALTQKTLLSKGKVRFPPHLTHGRSLPCSSNNNYSTSNGSTVGTSVTAITAATATSVSITAASSGPTAFVCFENPGIVFDVDSEHIDWETMNVAVFESDIQDFDDPNYVGKATGQMQSLQGLQGSDDVREFALQLKDINHMPAGKIVVSLSVIDSRPAAEVTTTTAAAGGGGSVLQLPPMTPGKTPRKIADIARSPRLGNVRIPSKFHNGWVHIHCITATSLNKFQLIGKHARYEHIRDQPLSPVPQHLKLSDVNGLQDPFVVCEIGDFWTSYTKVLLDQSWDCVWEQLKFSCYISSEDAASKELKLTVYDRSYEANDVYIGTALLPLVNLFAVPIKTEFVSEVTVYDRRGKSNGKLAVTTVCQGTEETGERWSVGTIRTAAGRGRYNVLYDDGEEEFSVHKDFIRLAPTVAHQQTTATTAMTSKQKKTFTQQPRFKRGDAVEVNSQSGRGVWLPAKIKSDNEDGTYDIDSDYTVLKVNVSEAHIRPMKDKSGTISPSPSGSHSRRPSGQLFTECKAKYSLWEKIEGNYKSKGTWYQGKVFKVRQYETYCAYDVSYDSGEVEYDVLEKSIRPLRSRSVTKFDNFPTAIAQSPSQQSSPRAAGVRSDSKTSFGNGSSSNSSTNNSNSNGRPRGASSDEEVVAADAGHSAAANTMTGSGGIAAADVRSESKFQVGQSVEVNYRGHGRYQRGCIEVDKENGFYDVSYDSGDVDEDVPEDLLRLPDTQEDTGPVRYIYQVGDKVLANYREIGKWIPGVVSRVRDNGVYDIHYDEGRNESKVSDENIRLVKANPHKPAKRSRFEVDQRVEVNVGGLGEWFPAHITRVVSPAVYDVQFEDGPIDYSVDELLLRRGGAYTPAIHCAKPIFKVGDRVRVVCRAAEVEKELRGLAAIKQRIAEERKLLDEEKTATAVLREGLKQRDEAFAVEEKRLADFLLVVGDAQSAFEKKYGPSKAPDVVNSIALSSDRSFYGSARDLKIAMLLSQKEQLPTGVEDSKEPAVVVGKVVTVEVSLGKMAIKSRDRICDRGDHSHAGERADELRADLLSKARQPIEVKARIRGENTTEEEMNTFKEAKALAEKELDKIMTARQHAMEENEALKSAHSKAESAKNGYHLALLKGQVAFAQLLREEVEEADRKRALQASTASPSTAAQNGHHPHRHASLEVSASIDAVPTIDTIMTLAAQSTVGMGDLYAASIDFNTVYGNRPPTPPPVPVRTKRRSLHVDANQTYDFDFQAVDFDGEVDEIVDTENVDDDDDDDDNSISSSDKEKELVQEPFIDVSDYTMEELYDAIFDTALGDAANHPLHLQTAEVEQEEEDTVVDYSAIYNAARRDDTQETADHAAEENEVETDNNSSIDPVSIAAQETSASSAAAAGNNTTDMDVGPKQQLKMSLLRLDDAYAMLKAAQERVEVATVDYDASNKLAQKKTAEVQFARNSVKSKERNLVSGNLSEGAATAEAFDDYSRSKSDFDQVEAQLQDRVASKESEIFKAEGIKQDRELETAAVRTFAEEKQRCDDSARKAMLARNSRRALQFILKSQEHVDKEIASLQSAIGHCKDETTALVTAKFFADEQLKAAIRARKLSIEYAIALTLLKNAQRECDLQRLRASQQRAQEADDDLDAAKELASIKAEEVSGLRDQVASAWQSLRAMRAKVASANDITSPEAREPTPRRNTPRITPRSSFSSNSRSSFSFDGIGASKSGPQRRGSLTPQNQQQQQQQQQLHPYGKEKSALKNKAEQCAKARAVEEEKAAAAVSEREVEERIAQAALETETLEEQRAAEEAQEMRISRK